MTTEQPPLTDADHPSERPTVADLADRLHGDVVTPDDDAYRYARRVWNGAINRYPAAVARCDGVGDVLEAVSFVRETDLPLAVRGGGHNVAGNATVDGGLVVDLSAMDAVRVDPDERTARVEGGATWADVDREAQRFGLATPGGVVSETGVAGLTLGGGLGHLRRQHGLACDSLRSADVVTGTGDLVTASADRNPDLFWALRGGGGRFGAVTSFEFDLHPVGPEVATCFVWYPADRGTELLGSFREWAADAPRAASVVAFYAWVPDEEPLPRDAWGDPAIVFLGAYAGDVAEGVASGVETEAEVLRPLRELGDPIVDASGPMAYADLQSMLDADYPDSRYYYWKSLYVDSLTDEVVEEMLDRSAVSPSTLSTVDLWHLGGAIADVPEDATAYANRDAAYLLNFEANWDDPALSRDCIEWARDGVAAVRELPGARGLYVNFPGFGEDPARTAYGENYERLAAVASKYDPDGLFG